jgi:hypothetical protein
MEWHSWVTVVGYCITATIPLMMIFLLVLQKLTSTNLFQASLFILDTNLIQWLIFKTSILFKETKNLVKEKTGFEFPLQTSEQK